MRTPNHDSRYTIIFCGILVAFIALGSESKGCAIVFRDGDKPVTMMNENVVIVWDPVTRTQHFVRQAEFRSDSKDFGFLVPTPTIPELAEADVTVFARLHEATQPKKVTKRGLVLYSTLFEFFRSPAVDNIFTNVDSSLPTGSPGIEVINEQTVAGFKASVLRAEDPESLAEWLRVNGYEFTPATLEWVGPYVKKGWIITAFKYEKEPGQSSHHVKTTAIRMSFSTEQPFFPYHEPPRPNSQTSPSRSLNVFMIAGTRMSGFLENSKQDWGLNAITDYSAELKDAGRDLAGVVPPGTLPRTPWMTVFRDHSTHRPAGGDLFFKTSVDQARIVPPPIINYGSPRHIPLCLDVVVVMFLVRWARYGLKRLTAQRQMAKATT